MTDFGLQFLLSAHFRYDRTKRVPEDDTVGPFFLFFGFFLDW